MTDVRRGIEYCTVPGFRPLLLDVHGRTEGQSAEPGRPAVVFLHGGGWQAGSRAVFCPTWRDRTPDPFTSLVAAGFVVVSVDYRLSGEARFPAQLDDVVAALRWVVEHAAEHGIDAGAVVVWGESAGGHLAALAGLHPDAPPVRGVIDWYGPADLPAMARQLPPVGESDSRESRLIGAAVGDAIDLATAASPTAHVHPGAPPFHIAHGTHDRLVPIEQSRALAAALAAVDVPVELMEVPGAGHLWKDAADPDSILTAAIGFARRVTG